MLKAIARLASSIRARGSNSAEPPAESIDLSDMPIIVAQSALEAFPEDPHPLVGAVIDYVNVLTSQGHFNRREIPVLAMAAYHADYYLAQVNNGGHSQFIHNSGANLPQTTADILYCLTEMDAEEYLLVFRIFNEWVQSHPDDVARQTGFDGGRAARLDELDDMFYAVESDGSLREMIAAWISTAPNLLALPDAQVANARARLCAANPYREMRDRILRIAGLDAQVTGQPMAAISMAAGVAQPLAAITRVGNGSYQEVEGEELMCVTLFTTAGKRWAALTDEDVVIYDCVEHDNPEMPSDPLEATMEQISNWKAPEIGEELGSVTLAQAGMAAEIAARTKAAAAIDLMLSQLLQPPRVDQVTIRSAGKGPDDEDGMTVLLVLNNAAMAMSAVIGENGASLLSEPDHQKMVQVTRAQIDVHAAENAIEKLVG
ncbi:DUF4375 domain-containing protein [uncultured Roseovarius sp.]|uniref:DMP19 family protein n=1 Tax=uncultured Roseovarius sp. TaxID=293344 RepID=UPI00262ECF1A|nr:DUF4375 domain-containing protein [uncultured Roseovarius sp.]